MPSGEPTRLVITDHAALHRLLESPALERLGVDYTVAAAGDVVATVRRLTPRAALIDLATDAAAGLAACRALRDTPDVADTPVVVVLGPGQRADHALIEGMARAGADDVMALPVHIDDFYYHLAHLTGLPIRRDRRVAVHLDIELPDLPGMPTGRIVNASAGGLGLRTTTPLRPGDRVQVRTPYDSGPQLDTPAIVAWCRPISGGFVTGLRFDGELPIRTRLLLEEIAPFDVLPEKEGAVVVIHGDLTEMTSFSPLAQRLTGARWIEFELSAVRYLSSAGVRSWCELLTGIRGVPYRFRHASVAFVGQAAMVPMVTGRGTVLSLDAPYLCESCDREEMRLLEPSSIARRGDHFEPPRLRCRRCGGELLFDDVPDRYFALLSVP